MLPNCFLDSKLDEYVKVLKPSDMNFMAWMDGTEEQAIHTNLELTNKANYASKQQMMIVQLVKSMKKMDIAIEGPIC